MKTFVQETAEFIYQEHRNLEEVTVVFPNRRAGLYLRRYISELIAKPSFAPALLTIEDFFARLTTLRISDRIALVQVLHLTYNETARPHNAETFEQFYFWGDMLLRDFDEIDKYMVPAELLFKDLGHQKELDSAFDYMTEEQKEFLKNFWGTFHDNPSANKQRFLNVWKDLYRVYDAFRSKLLKDGIAYEGLLHRTVAEDIAAGKSTPPSSLAGPIIFAGFNALTPAEEKVIAHYVSNRGATMRWDIDQYYVNDKRQEAGRFFRELQHHPILGKTFPSDIPANLGRKSADRKKLTILGAAQPVGQVKLMAETLRTHVGVFNPQETVIVLPDEKLLTPVLYGISECTDKMNVTMGLPLSATPMFNLVELLADLQMTRRPGHFNHRQVLAVLGHPYVTAADAVSVNNKRKEILRHNWVHIPASYLATEVELHRLIFLSVSADDTGQVTSSFIEYLKSVITAIGGLPALTDVDREYALQFLTLMNRLQQVFSRLTPDVPNEKETANFKTALKSFLRLFRQLAKSQRIPFAGEPLAGLQIMGVLETRNLDFRNVFILSLNEGSFPAAAHASSYIPYNIRRAYSLPTIEDRDAIYAYLFYRMLQRAENIFLCYNSETDVLGQGEMSRYLQQLIYESGLSIEKKILHNTIQPKSISPIVVKKDEQVIRDLAKLNEGNTYFQGISPSALNSYIECRLRFYFRHIAKIREPAAVEEGLDARILGNFLHDVMERFYRSILAGKASGQIDPQDFEGHEQRTDKLIDQVFIEAYSLDPEAPVAYEGQRLVVREVVRRFVQRIIAMDRKYAPFTIEALEQSGVTFTVPIDVWPFTAVVGGKIDRVDSKNDLLRVIDYKTGKDRQNFESIASLFARDGLRNKAAFQTLLYALLYQKSFMNNRKTSAKRILPGLINRMNVFDEEYSFGFRMGNLQLEDATPLLPEFEARLRELFNEMFDPGVDFDQTTDLTNCTNCPYTRICYR